MNIKQLSRLAPLVAICFFIKNDAAGQCPTLSQTSTLDPCGGQQPCNLCPGDVITMTTSGTNLKAGSCVKWYLGTTPNFNPYNNQGNYLGCSEIDLAPPGSCDECPQNIGIFVDACGTEQANEFMLITSGSGYYVDDMVVDFDDSNNGGPSDGDINDGGCPWGIPSAATIAAIQTACPGATVVGAGPGDIVPEGVLVMILTSAGFNYPYNWGGLCPLISTIYVMQNSCSRATGAFQNGGGGGLQSTTVSLACGCADNSTYDTGSLVGGNGAFYIDYLFPFYGNAGCGIPGGIPPLPPAPPAPLQVPPLDTTLWAGLCNSGPYWVVGIYTPLPPGCPQTFTNYMQFNVVCPTPALQPGATCNSVNNFNLDDLLDPNFPTGEWSGANVSGSTFNAMGLAPGNYVVKFDPDGDCALIAMTTITVSQAPKATLVSGNSTVCAGQPVNLTVNFVGTGPFEFTYKANGIDQPPVLTLLNPYTLTVSPTVNTVYSLAAMNDINCDGTFSGVYTVTTLPVPSASISGNAVICPGDSARAFINFGGTGPWTYSYSADGVIVDTLTTSKNPDTLWVHPTDTTIYKLVKIWNATCPGTVSGADTVNVKPLPTAAMSGSTAICAGSGQPVKLTIDFTGKGPWSFVYSINGIGQPSITTSFNPYQLTVSPSATTVYDLQSVSALGCAGTVSGGATVTVVTPPTAVLASNVFTCPGSPVQLSVTFTGGVAPWQFTFTENGFGQPKVVTSQNPYLLVVNPPFATTYTITGVSSGPCATGTVSGSVTVNPASLTANISGNSTIQAGQSATVVLNANGAPAGASITYNLTANGIPIPPITTTANPYNFVVMPSVTTVYIIQSATVNGCPATPGGSAVVTVQSNFTATILGDTTICNGGTAGLSVEFSSGATGPFTFVYAIDGVAQPAITTLANPHPLPVSPSVDAVYTLVSATSGTGVQGTLAGSATVLVNAPVLSIDPQNLPLCTGTSGSFTVSLTGANPPFSFIYEINGTPEPLADSPTASFQIPVTASVPTSYALVSGTAGGCPVSFLNQNASLQVVGPPQPNNIQLTCNFATMSYTVSFDVAAQPAPAGATSVNGTPVAGGTFTSAAIPFLSNYSFNLTNGCGQSMVAGQNTCLCLTDAGNMTFLDTLEVCIGGQAVAAHESDQVLGPGDVFEYILHTQPGIPVGGILAVNQTSPTFGFIPATMVAGQVYYISAIAGNDDGTGHADLADPCLSVATGTPVQFFDAPQMTIEVADTSICEGDTVKILMKLDGNGPFQFTYTKNGSFLPPVNTTKDAASDTYLISAVLQQTTTFQITTFNDATCAGLIPPPVTIHVNSVPTLLTQPVADCDLATFTYTVSCTVQGGNQQYLFSGGGGSFTGAFFESAPIPVGTAYSYFLGDTEQCGFINITGNPTCACITSAGQYPFGQPLTFCNGDPAALPPITGSVLEPGDTLIYVLHTTPGNDPQLWTILATNSQPTFTFNAGLMNVDSTYYISAMAGNLTAAGIDLSDPCLSVSPGVAVSWLPPVTAFLSGNLEICTGDTAHLDIIFSGNDAPYTFSFLENGVPQPPLVSTTDVYHLDISPSLSANYSLLTVDGATCPGSFNGGGGAAVSVLTHPDIIEWEQSCDFANQTYSIVFTITNGADPSTIFTVSGTPGGLSMDSIFTSDPIPFGTPYSFLVENEIGCDTLLTGLGQCACTSDAGSMDLQKIDGCTSSAIFPKHNGDEQLDGDDAPLTFILFEDPADPEGSVLATDNQPPISFQFDAATMAVGTTYYIATVAGDLGGAGQVDLSDPCLSVSPPVALEWHAPPTASMTGSAKLCAGQPAQITINFTGTGPWVFSYKINGVATPGQSAQPVFEIITTPQITQLFEMVSVKDGFCDGTVSGTALIEVEKSPEGSLTGPAAVCPGFPAVLTLNLIGGTTYDLSISATDGWDTTLVGAVNGQQIIVRPTGAGPVVYSITSLTSPQTPCFGIIKAPAIIEIKDLSQSLALSQFGAFNISCPGADDGTIEVSVSGGQPPYSYIWNTGAASKKITGLGQGWYQVTVTDAGGCIDSIYGLLYEPPPLVFDWRGQPAICFGGQEGTLTIESVIGGTAPYKISIDGGLSLTTNTFPVVFSNMAAGSYQVEVEDAGGCTSTGPASVGAASELLVELGPDIKLPLGDSVLLEGLVNYPVDSAWFSPVLFLKTPDSLASWSRPLNTMRYQLTVRDANGCTATDFILVEIDATRHVFVPNALYPEREGPNGVVTVFGGSDVVEISSFQIFDRWGNMVHEALEFQPNDLTKGWNGKARGGEKAAAAVYAYWLRVLFADGTSGVYKGDITLIR